MQGASMMFYSPGRRVRLMRFWRGGVLHLWFELKCRPALHHADTDRPHSGLGRDLIGFQWFLADVPGNVCRARASFRDITAARLPVVRANSILLNSSAYSIAVWIDLCEMPAVPVRSEKAAARRRAGVVVCDSRDTPFRRDSLFGFIHSTEFGEPLVA